MSSSTSGFNIGKAVRILLGLAVLLFLFDRGLAWLLAGAETAFYRDPVYKARFCDFMKGKSFSTLILGTSRTHEAIHPAYFRTILGQEAFREADAGKGPRYNYFFYDLYRKCAGVPRVIVYGIDYFMYEGDSAKEWLIRFQPVSAPPAALSSPSLLLAGRKNIEDFVNDLILRAGEILAPKPRETPVPRFVADQDFIGLDPKPGDLVTVRPRDFKGFRYNPYPGREGAWFKKLLDEWRADGVKVLLVWIPDYWGTFQTNKGRLRAQADLKRLVRGYPNVRIHDFNRPRIFPLTKKEYFRDGGWGMKNSHLSRAGAEAFDRILLERIRPVYARSPETERRP